MGGRGAEGGRCQVGHAVAVEVTDGNALTPPSRAQWVGNGCLEGAIAVASHHAHTALVVPGAVRGHDIHRASSGEVAHGYRRGNGGWAEAVGDGGLEGAIP